MNKTDSTGTERASRLERVLEAVLCAAAGVVLGALMCSNLPSTLSHLSKYIFGAVVAGSALLGYRYGREAVHAIVEVLSQTDVNG